MLVQDPTKGNSVDAIFDQARQSAVDVPIEPSSASKSFTGTARLLSGETVPSIPRHPEAVTHNVTFWRNGFSVNDGPLRRLDDPENAPFLEVTICESPIFVLFMVPKLKFLLGVYELATCLKVTCCHL